MMGQDEGYRDMKTHLDDLTPRQRLPRTHSVLRTPSVVELLPLLLEVVHRLLLFLARSGGVEADKEPCRVELEDLRSELGVDTDEDHGCSFVRDESIIGICRHWGCNQQKVSIVAQMNCRSWGCGGFMLEGRGYAQIPRGLMAALCV